jgi:peptidoglycan hydrolase-like protein with peptidoglycan-binding domain
MRAVKTLVAALVCTVVMVAGTSLSADALTAAGIRRAQERLNVLGCNAGPVDGVFGIVTETATIRFQSANGLEQTGRLNLTTRQRLYSARPTHCDARPVPRSGTGRRIVLSQRQNWLWLVGPAGRILSQGGVVDNPSALARGTYYTGPKCGRAAKIRDNSDYSGDLRLHNFVRFAPCGIGFHQIPMYWSNGGQIHRNFYLGTNLKASHGCIRVSRATSDRIWDFATIGTKVVVVR